MPPPGGGVAVTVNATGVVCEPEMAVPVTVMVELPVAAPGSTVTLMVELCPADTEAGLNTTVTPLGCPVAVRLMVCALPEVTAVLMVLEPEEPCWMDRLAGLAEMEKSFGSGVTVSATGVLCEPETAVPVTVMV